MTQFIQRIAMIEIPVSNLQLSIDWYERFLGLKLSWKGDNEATIDFPNGVLLCFLSKQKTRND
jgi:catechol 2,3-dioxygenase-like lactoylglutathione lyase family enzyme